MDALTETHFIVDDPITSIELRPRSVELAEDLDRLRREEIEAIDRRQQEELARLRRVQDQD